MATTVRLTGKDDISDLDKANPNREASYEVFAEAGDDLVKLNGIGNDTVRGDAGNDTVLAGRGNDVIYGGTGNDSLYGEAGQDTIYGEAGADVLDGGEGDDKLDGGSDNDLLNGGLGNDSLDGGSGDDLLFGNAGADYIKGGIGNDFIDGGADNDTILGEAGMDTIGGGDGNDYIDGGSDDDSIEGGDGNDTILGDSGDDILKGGAGNDSIDGGVNEDTILGEAGNDSLYGGTGEDSLDGGADNDYLFGDHGYDTLRGGDGNDTLDGGYENDQLFGDAGNDSLNGGGEDDTLDGGTGNDTLDGGSGSDVLKGGDGFDTFIASEGTRRDTISDFSTTGAGDKNFANNDFVDLSKYYNADTLKVWNATAGNVKYNNAIDWLRADQADGVLTWGSYTDAAKDKHTVNLAINNNGKAVDAKALSYDNTGVVCFTPGVLIETANGPVAVEALKVGDLVVTCDHGLQAVRWIGARPVSGAELAIDPTLRPVRISAGALGRGLPVADLVVSPMHRIVVSSPLVEAETGSPEALIAACNLIDFDGIDIVDDATEVTYIHFMCDRHEVVIANGTATETLNVGANTVKHLQPEAYAEILGLFPELVASVSLPVRQPMPGDWGRSTARRHAEEGLSLIG